MQEFTIEADGFSGVLFKAPKPFASSKVLIMLGRGGATEIRIIAEFFSKNGIDTLALAYRNAPGLPEHFIEIPTEFVLYAVKGLQKLGYRNIGIWGFEAGADLALLSASLYPQINSVIAVCPIRHIWYGEKGKRGRLRKRPVSTSCFSVDGAPLAYAGEGIKKKVFKLFLQRLFLRKLNLLPMYQEAMLAAPAEALIPIEKIKAPILFLSSTQDTIRPSKLCCDQMLKQLNEARFKYNCQHLYYSQVSHLLFPFHLAGLNLRKEQRLFKVERKFPKECNKSRVDAFNKTIEWLKNNKVG
ncbi:acyl-CoA thioester hydrolase/BAAT C-terminal domain-containing protein [Treponema phagedenis]|uniref:BAAT/Acyl-CoA thioester hydrolase C-terminal domain-containing protein n=1 Tax=Treponema phagedenis TaxID=162 RepID=A0AAE6M6I7_TREPH|nr:acyl-CoA thioester hydrolase/BAAT C-terminal domain-containing protein [Treponema phagedenis]EFW36495.1 BAAT/acyl-CoA thioester hydrolase C-terminal domain protein [Treponema phagedenis F0421]NVP23947.1 hypothetical protein [Treponema phagedenis]QEJ93857.1 hypothetical protein FUT79_00575 [Treponema phagedenis]QEJ96615.1 hypothetical protein FUT82_00375 [Treponema phagedenis]QEK07290.1 hypothetical protein FUT80_11565 [Treponema phagedenis]